MKLIRKVTITIIFLFLLFIGFGLTMAFLFRHSAVDYLKKYLDKHLLTEIQVDDIRFSVLKRFPYATVELKNVVVKSTVNFSASDFTGLNTDTLLAARKVHFEFGLLSLIKENYKLKNITVSNGKLLALTDRTGKINYNIWQSEKVGKSEPIALNLQNVVFSGIELKEINLVKNIDAEAYIRKINLHGDFSGDHFSINARGNGTLNDLIVGKLQLPRQKELSIDMAVDGSKGIYKIKKGNIVYADINLNANGSLNPSNNNEINIDIKGDKINLKTLLPLLPKKLHTFSSRLNTSGWLSFRAKVRGNMTGNLSPLIETEFNLNNGSLTNRKTKSSVTDISFNGVYTNGKFHDSRSSSLQINDISLNMRDKQVTGQYSVQNFLHPLLNFHLQGTVPLDELAGFVDSDSLEYASGNLEANLSVKGNISKIDSLSQQDFTKLDKKGSINFNNASFKLKRMKFPLKNVNGEIRYSESVELHNFSLLFAGNDFLLNGYLKNGLDYLFHKNQPLVIIADIKSDTINIDNLLLNKGKNTGNKEDAGINLPGFLQVNAQLNAKTFTYGKFHADNVSCIVEYEPYTLSIQQFKLNSLEGNINGKATIVQDESKNFDVSYFSHLQNVNLNQLFYIFNNFSQNVIIDKNLKGIVTGNVSLYATWDNNLKINKESIVSLCDIEIREGELLNFEPVLGLSKFIEVDELKDIRFKTLKNQISIRDKTITIPQMDINSSAFDISGSGVHHFDDSYEYRVKILLSDFLFNKAKKRKKENSEFGVIEDDGLGRTGLYLTIKGKGSDFKVAYDKKKAFTNLIESLRLQKKELKNSLNDPMDEELNTINNSGGSSNNQKFILDWEDNSVKKDSTFENKAGTSDTKKPEFIIKWDDADTDSIK